MRPKQVFINVRVSSVLGRVARQDGISRIGHNRRLPAHLEHRITAKHRHRSSRDRRRRPQRVRSDSITAELLG